MYVMENMNNTPTLKSAISKVIGKEVGHDGTQWLIKDDGVFVPLSTVDMKRCVEQHTQDVKAHEDEVKVTEAKAYLEATDFKMTVDYDEDVTEVKLKRQEAREFIRANEIKE
jgi:hypothetical protein